jgi:pilus assembly protein CpaF
MLPMVNAKFVPPRPGRPADAGQTDFEELKRLIHGKLVDKLDLTRLGDLEGETLRREIRLVVEHLCDTENPLLNRSEREKLIEEVLDETFGFGPLEALLKEEGVADIMINGPKHVFLEKQGRIQRSKITFRDNDHLMQILDRIVSKVGRRIDETTPMCDARLPDGSRVNAIIPPLAVDGPLLSIRRFSTDKMMPRDLVNKLALTSGMMELLEAAVKAKLNIIISGGTGAGKTTLLNALSAFISPKERIVTIEDAAELQLKQPHVVRLETRPPNIEGNGAVRQRELLVNCLRMRPDRIVVGEVRGGEALDMLQAMNTGHDGSLTTVHANSPRDAISRLEVMIAMATSNMKPSSIRQQIASAVHLLVQVSRMSDGSRRVVNLTEVTGMEGDVLTLQDVFVFEKRGLNPDGRVVGRFAATGIRPKFTDKLLAAGIRMRPDLFDESVEV